MFLSKDQDLNNAYYDEVINTELICRIFAVGIVTSLTCPSRVSSACVSLIFSHPFSLKRPWTALQVHAC